MAEEEEEEAEGGVVSSSSSGNSSGSRLCLFEDPDSSSIYTSTHVCKHHIHRTLRAVGRDEAGGGAGLHAADEAVHVVAHHGVVRLL